MWVGDGDDDGDGDGGEGRDLENNMLRNLARQTIKIRQYQPATILIGY